VRGREAAKSRAVSRAGARRSAAQG